MASEWGFKLTIPAGDTDLNTYKKGPATCLIALAAGTVKVVVPSGGVGEGGSSTVELTFPTPGARGILFEKILGTGAGSSAIDVEVHWDVSGT